MLFFRWFLCDMKYELKHGAAIIVQFGWIAASEVVIQGNKGTESRPDTSSRKISYVHIVPCMYIESR